MTMESDVIIVGAGAAGLSAAMELGRRGVSFTLIEGADRIGGRAYSQEIVPGVWFDRGCSWLVGGATNPFVPIADALGIPLSKGKSYLFERPSHRFYRNGQPLDQSQRDACLRHFSDADESIDQAASSGRDVALADVIEVDTEFSPPFLQGIATSWGLDVDRISTADHASSAGELGYQAYSGYGSLVTAWGANIAVTLGARAQQITLTRQGVTVETDRGSVTGRAAILTVSTGILASGEIRFAPDLPDWKFEAISHLPMGIENKIGLHFDRDVFGPEGRGHFTTWNDDGTRAKMDVSVMGFNTAVVFVGGRQAVWFEQQGESAARDFAIDRVADVFGNDIRRHADQFVVTAWNNDPWARGSWACAEPGQAHQRAALARPVDDRLFFAGEATLYGDQGTCHGAYLSGLRAAREATERLTKPA